MEKAARRIVEKLRLNGHEAFFSGGWVRDRLLRRKARDIDIATDAPPDKVRRIFPHSYAVGEQFGVVQVGMYGRTFEVATFRRDAAYQDGRHPTAVTFSGPEQDARRRDFTINGLFFDPVAERLIDYVRGKSDIERRLIRTIGDARERFAEDKLRMLRAVRLACSLDFRIVPETMDAIRRSAPDIRQVSWERIRDELIRILTAPAPARGLELLRETGLLAAILPEVQSLIGIAYVPGTAGGMDVFGHTKKALMLLRKPSPALALGTLLHDSGKSPAGTRDDTDSDALHALRGAKIGEEVCRRLKLSNRETRGIVALVAHHMDFARDGSMTDKALRRLFRRPDFADHLELFRVNSLGAGRGLDAYSSYLKRTKEYALSPETPPLVTGDDLIEMGYAPGPVFSRVLREIEDLQLDGVLRTRAEALEHIGKTFPLKGKSEP